VTAEGHQTRWRASRLADCVDAVSTGPFGSLLHKDDYVRGGTPVINPINLRDGLIVHNAEITVADALASQLNSYRVRSGDILVARRGDIGRCGLVLPSQDGWICGTGCFVIRTGKAVDAQFLTLLLGSPIYRAALEAVSTGTTMLNLSNKALSNLEIFLPPLEEQKRIVAVLDQAFAALDRARALAEANLADAEEIYSPLFSQALRQDMPPDHWQQFRLDEIADLRGGYAFKSGQYTEGGAFVLRTVNIHDSGELIRGKDKYISEDEAPEYDRFRLRAGDTLFVMVGATLGKIGFVKESDTPALLNQNMWVIRPLDDRCDPAFLNALFKQITSEIVANSRGAARSFVKREDVRKLNLFLPPVEEQAAIMERVGSAKKSLATLEVSYRLSASELDDLRQSILRKAFAGELT
jgi:type I restriction enzyme S subunit